jgi:hypothetical protein
VETETLQENFRDTVNRLDRFLQKATDPIKKEALIENINHKVDVLNKLFLKTTDPKEKGIIRILRIIYFVLLEELIEQKTDNETQEFKQDIEALKTAYDKAPEAKKDLKKVAETIGCTVSAVKVLEKLVGLVLDFIANKEEVNDTLRMSDFSTFGINKGNRLEESC